MTPQTKKALINEGRRILARLKKRRVNQQLTPRERARLKEIAAELEQLQSEEAPAGITPQQIGEHE